VSAQTPQDNEPKVNIQVDVIGRTQKQKLKEQWGEVRSENFVVAGDADESDLKRAASELELFRLSFSNWFPKAAQTSSVPTRVIMFRDRQLLKTFRPNSDAPSDSSYFQASPDLNYLVLGPGEKLTRDVLREYARTLLRDSVSPLPLWLETGIAEYFSLATLLRLGEDRISRFGIDEFRGISEKKLIPVTRLFTFTREEYAAFDQDDKKAFVAQSCTLFQYLLQTGRMVPALKMINALAEGQKTETAIKNAFKLPSVMLDANLKNHVHMSKAGGWSVYLNGLTMDPKKHSVRIIWERQMKTFSVRFDSLRQEVESLPVRILSDAEADMYRGDLQTHNGRLEEGQAFLLQALREDGTLASAYASLGLTQSLQKRFTEAYASFEKARVLDPKGNALGYYYTARAIRDESRMNGTPLTKAQLYDMQIALSDARDINPTFVEVAEMLAETQLLLGQDVKGSTQLLLDGMRRSLGRQSLLLLLGRIAIAGNDKASAGYMLQRVIVSGSASNEQRAEAQKLLDLLNLTPTERNAFADFQMSEPARNAGMNTSFSSKESDRNKTKIDGADVKIIRGMLTKVECKSGITLYLRIGTPNMDERVENLHTNNPANVEWVNDLGEEVEAVKCENLIFSPFVSIAYKPKRKGLMMGEPIFVEFCNGTSFDCDVKHPPMPSP
jgi:tetratricopeptide (TPR) repeat protein